MVVLITNVTDAPGGKHAPRQIDIYNKTLGPGDSTRIPAELINLRVRGLETEGLIAIGSLPSWYKAAKARKGKRLTDEEKDKLIVRKPSVPLAKKLAEPKKPEAPTLEVNEDSNRKR